MIRYVKYGIGTIILFIIANSLLGFLISMDVYPPFVHIFGSVIVVLIAYISAYKRYKLNANPTNISFKRMVILDPSIMVLSLPITFLLVYPGFMNLVFTFSLALSCAPYILTNKELSGSPEKKWSELKTKRGKILYSISYILLFALIICIILAIVQRILYGPVVPYEGE